MHGLAKVLWMLDFGGWRRNCLASGSAYFLVSTRLFVELSGPFYVVQLATNVSEMKNALYKNDEK